MPSVQKVIATGAAIDHQSLLAGKAYSWTLFEKRTDTSSREKAMCILSAGEKFISRAPALVVNGGSDSWAV